MTPPFLERDNHRQENEIESRVCAGGEDPRSGREARCFGTAVRDCCFPFQCVYHGAAAGERLRWAAAIWGEEEGCLRCAGTGLVRDSFCGSGLGFDWKVRCHHLSWMPAARGHGAL